MIVDDSRPVRTLLERVFSEGSDFEILGLAASAREATEILKRTKPDYLFQSVAAILGRESVGVILTGMGADGAKGLLEMKKKGAKTIAQDEASCVVYGMPRAAFELGAVDRVAALGDIPNEILMRLSRRSI